MTRAALALVICALLSTGCVESSKKSGPSSSAQLAAYVLDEAPPVAHALAVELDGKVKLLGYKLDPEGVVTPGQELRLTLYWQVNERPGDGWSLFTHLVDERGVKLANYDNAGPLRDASAGRQALPPSDWQAGKVYIDEQRIRLPQDISGQLTLVTGLWRGDERMRVVGPGADSEGRVIVARLASSVPAPSTSGVVTAGRPRFVPPSMNVTRISGLPAPKIDGKLDDAIWKQAATTGMLIDVSSGAPNRGFPVNGSVRVAWDEQHLYFGFEIEDDNIIGGFEPGSVDSHLWERECVEIMIDPDGDGDNRDYYEIQISPQNLVFDSQFDDYNLPRGGPDGPFGHQDWSIRGQTAVVVDGTLDDSSDKDRGYTVEAAIPWSSFSKAKQAPPAHGDTWRMNFYGMKHNGGVAWSPILREGNFHKAKRFGYVTFLLPGQPLPSANSSATPVASASAAPAPSASAKSLPTITRPASAP